LAHHHKMLENRLLVLDAPINKLAVVVPLILPKPKRRLKRKLNVSKILFTMCLIQF
jgi:hypothetical protein